MKRWMVLVALVPLALSTIAYATIGVVLAVTTKSLATKLPNRTDLISDQRWFLVIFLAKLGLGLIAFSWKPCKAPSQAGRMRLSEGRRPGSRRAPCGCRLPTRLAASKSPPMGPVWSAMPVRHCCGTWR